MEHLDCSPERVCENFWGGFSDGERGDCGVVVERSFWFAK